MSGRPERDEWNVNPANPRVQVALEETFMVPLQGLELQGCGTALDSYAAAIMDTLAHGELPPFVPDDVPRAEALAVCLKMAKVMKGVADRLEGMWNDLVEGRAVALNDMPPDPFGNTTYL